MAIGVLILLVSAVLVFFPLRFFRTQRKVCQKYPFYQLRDEIIKGIVIAKEEDRSELLGLYGRANLVISKIKKLNFKFFVEVMTLFIEDIMEKKLGKIKEEKQGLNDLEKKFVSLVILAARQNSYLLRIAMTKFGYMILFTPAIIRAAKRFNKNHPELIKTRKPQIKAIWQYSMLAQAAP
jgi:hypothetical protein